MSPRQAIATATALLRDAGVASPEYDAAELLAHVLGTTRARLPLVTDVPDQAVAAFDELVGRRAAREPLQHLTGTAYFRHGEVAVGPGVFVPRPETELLAGWAVDQAKALVEVRAPESLETKPRSRGSSLRSSHLDQRHPPVVVDLCTGSGVIAKAIAEEVPWASVHAVELDESAYAWAERNLAGTGVDLRHGDLTTAFEDLLGRVDVVVSNPPYVPLEAWESVAQEARDHDPHLALFSGEDGLDAIRAIAGRAAELLRPGGVVGVEHADVQGESAPAVFAALGSWNEVRDHPDLTGRPRFLTARRAVRGSAVPE